MNPNDKRLGMDRAVTRRDFLNGTALAIGSLAFSGNARAADKKYPPALTGLRGQHDGSFEVMHAIRDKDFWDKAGANCRNGRSV